MGDYIRESLFVHDEHGSDFLEPVLNNSLGTTVIDMTFDEFFNNPLEPLKTVNHVVVSGSLATVKEVIVMASTHGFSMGIIPLPDQKELIQCYVLPVDLEEGIKLALGQNTQKIDLIYCNDQLMVFKAIFGRVPLLDSPVQIRRLRRFTQAVKRLKGIQLFGLELITNNGRKLKTAASGCMIIQHQTGTLASRLIGDDSSLSDGMISLVVSAPMSIIEYLTLIFHVLAKSPFKKRIASTVGLIKSPTIHIECDEKFNVILDDIKSTQTPLTVSVDPGALNINIGSEYTSQHSDGAFSNNEKLSIDNLPSGKELERAKKKRVPFFAYASEERFRDLFTSLYDDARINSIYIILMVLSTLLATLGLYLDSSSVIIGAMLLAPLMGPIVSLGMGVLRSNTRMVRTSVVKICIGVTLALASSAIVVKLLPYDPNTSEMLARLNPSLLDLLVAVLAGIAGAYTKSFKEILQSLAGVAIAVALVPPLAVAGIGLGRWDFAFFNQAFLLFFTNFIGIVIAASVTFRVLGYSSAIKSKKSLAILIGLMSLTIIPLYISYNRIVTTHNFEKTWNQERFLVGNKYLIVTNAQLIHRRDKNIITMTILARDRLIRRDLIKLKEKIQQYYSEKLEIRSQIVYIH